MSQKLNAPSGQTIAQNIKIFLDGADEAAMKAYVNDPWIKGFTTNPSLMKKSGITDYVGFCKKILTLIPNHPISFEVFADEISEMKEQAKIITTWGKNVYVKIPVMNTKGESTAPLIKELSHAGIQLNVTAIFTLEQTQEVCQALAGGAPSVVSIFAGRIADSGRDPMPLMKEASAICRKAEGNSTGKIELLWASTREVYNLVQAIECGCQIITAPADIVKKLKGFGKDLYEMSAEVISTFKKDSESAGFKL